MAKRKLVTTKQKMGRRARTKGATFERWVSTQLKQYFPDAHRQPQSQIKQLKQIASHTPEFNPCLTDVVAGPFGIECKHRKVLPSIPKTLEQAASDCGGSGKIPVAIHKPHGGTAYDIQVGILYGGDVLILPWLEFMRNCERIAREHQKDQEGDRIPGSVPVLDLPRGD